MISKKICALSLTISFILNLACLSEANCGYWCKRKMIKNHKNVQNKVINAQVKGKMEAIKELAKNDCPTSPESKKKICCYQKEIEELTNQKICLKREYKSSLKALRECGVIRTSKN